MGSWLLHISCFLTTPSAVLIHGSKQRMIFVDKKAGKSEDLFQAERQEREREWLHCNHAVNTTPTRRTTTTVHTKHTYTTILYESIYECHAYIYSVFYSIHCLSNVDDVDMIERLFGYLLGKKTDKEDEKMINGDKK